MSVSYLPTHERGEPWLEPELESPALANSVGDTHNETWSWSATKSMGDLQDPKMKVLYHIRPYFVGIFPEI